MEELRLKLSGKIERYEGKASEGGGEGRNEKRTNMVLRPRIIGLESYNSFLREVAVGHDTCGTS